ncbi:hypothetical protein OSH11_22805 [Kaistia dalseonensis]|uniref:Serine acetyltransferase n=1 Tax=Kaistia dalseonensis TaxID=410840 RepID=A0ABU0HF95_9HYPH|nr:hypothetical protein [Kaistia dalseonensis]MCX5497546.1 hypothetical protein [Kaistia dalseonensis]MDQ0440186.1 serine O-acetyltransferase [Kaistia dalseonensis]
MSPGPANETNFFGEVQDDIDAWMSQTNHARSATLLIRLFLVEPGFQLILSHRLQKRIGTLPLIGGVLRRLLWYVTTILTGCHIAPTARIGGGAFIPHPTGIVIGGHSVVGRNVALYQQVTIGRRDPKKLEEPVIGDGCRLFVGARILGSVLIGPGCDIGAGAIVLEDLPEGVTAVGAPARIVARTQS